MYKKNTNKIGIPDSVYQKILLIMRLTTVLLMTSLMQVSANTLAQKITLSEKNAALEQVFIKIKHQTGYDFVAGARLLKEARLVNIKVRNVELTAALEQIFENQPLQFEIQDKMVVVRKKPVSYLDKFIARFQAIDVRGKILDEKGDPLAGATVAIKGSGKSVKTNAKGEFYLQNVDEKDKLLISYIGYQTKEVNASADLGSLTMAQADAKLEEVMINAGYYTVKDSERTGSISRITAKDIEKQPVTNVLATMQGRMAGVSITQTSGVPGSGFDIQIRGRNSLRTDGNNPMYIVDGMPLGTESLGSSILSASILPGVGINALSILNPADIESIEVLKDADATAIYGSRGANGVVLITTKKAKAGKTLFTTNFFTGIGQLTRRLDLLNTEQYLEMRREAFENDGIKVYPADAHDINGNWNQSRYTDWQKELIGNTSVNRQADLSISGGNESTKLMFKVTNYNETSVFHGDFKYGKTAFQLSGNHISTNQKLKLDLSLQYVLDRNDLPGTDLTLDAINLAPNAPALYDEAGNLNWENSTWDNPVRQNFEEYLAKTNFLNAGGSLTYNFFSDLEMKIMAGFSDTRLIETKISPSTLYNPAFGLNSTYSFLLKNNGYQQSWSLEPQLQWQKKFNNSKINVLVGTTFQQRSFGTHTLQATGFANNSMIYNMAAANSIAIYNNDNSIYRYQAVFGRMNYTFNEKYIFNLTGRRDGSSRFGPGKQFASFGAVGAAWLFGKEGFFSDHVPGLSFGKLRTSYGSTGSDQIGDYQFLDTFSSTGLQYQGIVGLQPNRLYNPDFSWEINKKFEVAIDLGFFNDRLFLTTAYFKNKSSSQLVGIPLPGSTGFVSIQSNFPAEVQNTGIELEWNSKNIKNSNFSWSTAFNITFPENKLVSFPDLKGSTYASQYVIGEPLNIQMVYHYTNRNPETGLYEFKDYNGDGMIGASYDRKKLIDLTPDFFAGLQNTFMYKQWNFDFLFQFVKQFAPNFNNFKSMPGLSVNQSVDVLSGTQPFSAGFNGIASNAYSFIVNSDAAFRDASFIRLKNISLSYTLPTPSGWSSKLYIQGQNVLTFTKYQGLDPENYSGSRIPPLRVLTLGAQITF